MYMVPLFRLIGPDTGKTDCHVHVVVPSFVNEKPGFAYPYALIMFVALFAVSSPNGYTIDGLASEPNGPSVAASMCIKFFEKKNKSIKTFLHKDLRMLPIPSINF